MSISSSILSHNGFSENYRGDYLKKIFSGSSSKNVPLLAKLLIKNWLYIKITDRDEDFEYPRDAEQKLKEELYILKDNLDSFLSEDEWDFMLDYNADVQSYKINILYYKPEAIIKNSNDVSQNLKEIFVRIPLYIRYYPQVNEEGMEEGFCFTIGKFQFLRLHYTFMQQVGQYSDLSLYMHSHVSTTKLKNVQKINFSDRCLGSDDLGSYFGGIHTEEYINRDVLTLEHYFLYLNTYIGWESLEGGPYKKMTDLVGPGVVGGDIEFNIIERVALAMVTSLENAREIYSFTTNYNAIENPMPFQTRRRGLYLSAGETEISAYNLNLFEELDIIYTPRGEVKVLQNEKLSDFVKKNLFLYMNVEWGSDIINMLRDNPDYITYRNYYETCFVVDTQEGAISYRVYKERLLQGDESKKVYKNSFLIFNSQKHYLVLEGSPNAKQKKKSESQELPPPEYFNLNPLITFYAAKYIESQLQRRLLRETT